MQGERQWRDGLDDPWVQVIFSDPEISVHEEPGTWFLYRPGRIFVHPTVLDTDGGRAAEALLKERGASRVKADASAEKARSEPHTSRALPLGEAAAAAEAIGLELWTVPEEADVPSLIRELREHSPMVAAPVHVLFADPHKATGCGPATPAAAPTGLPGDDLAAGRGLTIAVLDTGIDPKAAWAPVVDPEDHEILDSLVTGTLDPAAGHGTFVAALIHQEVPGATLHIERVLTGPGGVADETEIALAIGRLPKEVNIVNCSFGGPALDNEPPLGIAQAIGNLDSGVVVVAAAGNDAEDRPHYPAAFKGVIAIGAVEDEAKQWAQTDYTNFGWWVDGCAPGPDLHSAFPVFKETTAAQPRNFEGGALWSGTSFSTPRVVAAIAKHATDHNITVTKAAYELIGDPSLTRIKDLGTLVVP